jgi:hypothetical protein
MRTLWSTLAAAAVLAACAGPPPAAGSDDLAAVPPTQEGGSPMTVEITTGPVTASAGEEHHATAEPAPGGLTVHGTITLPTPCHRLAGAAEETGGELVVRVSASPDPDAMCAQVIATHGYRAEVRGVPPGSYTLRVVHGYPESGWDEQTALTTQVTVQ